MARRFLVFALCLATFAFAEEPAQSGADEPQPDKSRYTLFYRTPRNLMRDLDTDRPDKTNSPATVDAGHFVLETGLADFTRLRDRDVRTDTWTLGAFNFRLGILNDLELSAAVDAEVLATRATHAVHESSRLTGCGDTVVGGKYNFFGNDGEDHPLKIALGIQPQFKIPTAQRDVGNGHFEFTVGLPFAVTLPKDFGLTMQTTPGYERNSRNTAYVTSWQNSVTLDHPLIKNLSGYIELWSRVTTEKHQTGQATLDVGVFYKITKDLQLDTGVNIGLNKQSPAMEWFLGISYRR